MHLKLFWAVVTQQSFQKNCKIICNYFFLIPQEYQYPSSSTYKWFWGGKWYLYNIRCSQTEACYVSALLIEKLFVLPSTLLPYQVISLYFNCFHIYSWILHHRLTGAAWGFLFLWIFLNPALGFTKQLYF